MDLKFSRKEEIARDLIINTREPVSLDWIWSEVGGKKETPSWRSQAAELMRRVCIKSKILPPAIYRTTRLGRGSKAFYSVEGRER